MPHPTPAGRARALVSVALWIAICGCDDSNQAVQAETRCGAPAGGIANLPPPTPVWTHAREGSIYYAPRTVDLNDDGKLEALVSGGNEEPVFGELVVMDATTGHVLWQASADKELYSSPVLLDVTGDGVKDVFAGGRLSAFIAVEGARGKPIWTFEDTRVNPDYNFYNFYTPVVIPDQTGDGVPDLLIANGGGDGIPPGEARPPGHMLVVNAADGSLLSVALLPDGQETYMSPILLPDDGAASPTILFGTGGESWKGYLWETSLSAVMTGDLSSARKLVTGTGKGIIAPPALADLDGDGRLDIIVATFDGRLIVLGGATREILWQRTFEASESYSTPTIGFFDGDDIPDVFAVFLRGTFPDYISAERVLLSGRDGRELWREEAGDFAMASDVAVDLNGDGIDEVIFNTNTLRDPLTGRPTEQQLYLLDTVHRQARPWGPPTGGFAPGSPWVGDVDADGCLDLLLPRHSSEPGTEPGTNYGRLTRFRLAAPVPPIIRWGGYFGTKFDSTAQAKSAAR